MKQVTWLPRGFSPYLWPHLGCLILGTCLIIGPLTLLAFSEDFPPILATNFSFVISSPYCFHFTERDRRVGTITFFSGGSRGQISASRRDIRTAVFAAFHNSRMLPQISTRLFLFHSFPFNYSPIALPFGVTCFEVLTYIDKLNSFPCRSKYVFQNCSQTS